MANEAKKLKGKKLDKEIERLFYVYGRGVQFNIFNLSKITRDVMAAYNAGGDMDEAMKVAVAKYRDKDTGAVLTVEG